MVRIAAEEAGPEEDAQVTPDVIQNRFGSLYGTYTLLELEDGGRRLLVPLHVEGKEARLGLFLSDASTASLEELCAFVFARFHVKRISWDCSLNPLGKRYVRRNHPANHWKVPLPATAEELWGRMSRKSRYNRRREEKILLERLGTGSGPDGSRGKADETNEVVTADAPGKQELVMTEYAGAGSIPVSVVKAFFDFKRVLMGREYGLSPEEYLSSYHVTNAYTWTCGERTIAIVFSCEQGQDVFLENLTYAPELEEFSPGFHLYALVLERLVAKGKRSLFLGGGRQPYKSRFGGTEDSCWNVEAYRSPIAALPYYAHKLAGRIPILPRAKGGKSGNMPGGKQESPHPFPRSGSSAGRGGKSVSLVKRACRFVRIRVKWAAQKLFYSIVPVGKALNTEKRDFSLTISLTSFPPRLATLHLCVKSLMRQTMKPDRIILYLGADCEGVPLPKRLLSLTKKGLTVRYVGGDLRPHKKYMYAMREFPGDCIITADDDLIYCRDMVKSLWQAHEKNPGALAAHRVHLMRQEGGRILPYRDWLHETGSVRRPTHALLSTNGAGSLFPPHCLPAEALDEELAARLCLNADDIWLKFMLIRGGTKVVWAGMRTGMPDEIRIRAGKKRALMDANLTKDGNDAYIAAMESYFRMSLADYCLPPGDGPESSPPGSHGEGYCLSPGDGPQENQPAAVPNERL